MTGQTQDMVLPQLGMGMAEGVIQAWLVGEGAEVVRDQPIVSIETEKVVTELPSPTAGFVHQLAQAGEKIQVEALIAKIAASKEAYDALVTGDAADAVSGASRASNEVEASAPARGETPSPTGRVVASGAAKALARQRGIDLTKVAGTGPGGRIVESDVLGERATLGDAPSAPPATRRVKAKIPLAGTRRVIADRMVKASTEAAQTFAFFEVDVTALIRVREAQAERLGGPDVKLSLLAFYARAVALACRKVPIVNSTLEDDAILVWDDVNIGIAVSVPGSTDLDSGLLVPVIRGVDGLGVGEINERIRLQARRAREGSLNGADMAGGTITISSTDGFLPGAWLVSTPLLNLPQAVNFQPGTPVARPVVVGGEIVIRDVLPCGLTFDHRCVDGEPIGRFVREFCGYVQDPELLL